MEVMVANSAGFCFGVDRAVRMAEEAARTSGGAVRLLLRVGTPPQASPGENLRNLLSFGSQFDNIEIK